MKMAAFRARADVRKASLFAIVVNTMELMMVLVVLIYIFIEDKATPSPMVIRVFAGVAALMTGAGAVVDVREALFYLRAGTQVRDMAQTISDMERLNNTLRAQRHDFLNHLQVVYSLMEMKDYDEANKYIEQVYGAITAVSRVMKTANPAVNALLQVKVAACEQAGIRVSLQISSSWKHLPMESWEMCKVLSNLIDNAMDALKNTPSPEVRITLTEDLHSYRFAIGNNGEVIPEKNLKSIFQPGITTKAAGHGMGLYIVQETLRRAGGGIEAQSSAKETVFSGWVPRAQTQPVEAA